MMTLKETVGALRALRTECGRGNFDEAVRMLNRERLQNYQRDARISFSKAKYQRLFDEQRGICPVCNGQLEFPAIRNEVDHKDPNRTDFNAHSNLQLVHGRRSRQQCNQRKGASSMLTQAKRQGKTFANLVGPA